MRPNSRWLARAAAVAAVCAAGACGNGSNSGGGNVRVIAADASATSNFEVEVNGTVATTNLPYGNATAYGAVTKGTADVQFFASGSTTNAELTASFAVAGGEPYSVLAIQGSSALADLVVTQSSSAVSAGQMRLSFVHAAPAQGTLDIFVTSPTAALPATTTIAPIAYSGDNTNVTPESLTMSSGDYRIRAIVDGDATRTVIFDSGTLSSTSGADLLMAIVPQSGSAASFSLLVTDASSVTTQIRDQRALVRAANFAPAAGAVDSFIDPSGTANSATNFLTQDLSFDQAGAYTAYLPASYRASIAATGQTAEIAGAPLVLAASTSVSFFAVGISGASSPANLQLLEITDDLTAPATGMAKMRMVAMAPDLAAVDVVVLNAFGVISQRLTQGLSYVGGSSTGVSAYVPLAAGSYTIAVVPTGADTPLLPSTAGVSVSLASGSVYTLAISGCEHPGSGVCAGTGTALTLTAVHDR